VASAINSFFGGASTNTSGTNTGMSTALGAGSQQGQTTSTPNLPSWYSNFLQSLPGQFQGLSQTLSQNATKPLYGPQQQASFFQSVDQQKGQDQMQLNSQLASQGALNSGRAAEMNTSLMQGASQQKNNYLAQVPLMNAQYQSGQLGQLMQSLGLQSGFTSPINAYGTTATTQGNTTSSNQVNSSANSSGTGQTTPNVLGSIASSGNLLGGLGNFPGAQGLPDWIKTALGIPLSATSGSASGAASGGVDPTLIN